MASEGSGDRASYVLAAESAEFAERYDDMVDAVKKLANIPDIVLTADERNLLSVAYKNVVGARRASWRILSSIYQRTHDKDPSSWQLDAIKDYRAKVEVELDKLCRELLDLTKHKLLHDDKTKEGKVFLLKMAGDYHRYLAEFTSGTAHEREAALAEEQYKIATAEAEELKPTHPIRLGLALNYSVFNYEIMNKPAEACKLAKSGFDAAIGELDGLGESQYKDSTLIMQLIRDNLTLWTDDAGGEDDV